MASTKVEIRDNREMRRVEAIDGEGQVAGYAAYQISVDGQTFDFQHTEVDERFTGQGIGTQLAAGVMEFARSEGITITPTCTFIQSYMDEHEETNDLRTPEPSDEPDEDDDDDRSEQPDDQDTSEDEDQDEDQDEDASADEDSPDAGPADAKAAGSGGATDEEASRA